MEWKKLAPWNWFRDEEAHAGHEIAHRSKYSNPSVGEVERFLDHSLRRFFAGDSGAGERSEFKPFPLRPAVDIKERKKAYIIQAELPGVDEDDIHVEIDDHRLVIRAEKKQESETDDEGYHCIERSYGMVQRVLSLPDDADPEAIEARFRHGVLKLEIAKHPTHSRDARRIEVSGS